MNKFAKLKAVNRLLVKIAAASTAQVLQPAAPTQSANLDYFPTSAQRRMPRGNRVSKYLPGAMIGSNGDILSGYGVYAGIQAHHPYLRWLGRFSPLRRSTTFKAMQRQVSADATQRNKGFTILQWNKGKEQAQDLLILNLRRRYPHLGQAGILKIRPHIDAMQEVKRLMAQDNPTIFYLAGVLPRGASIALIKKARKYYGGRPAKLLLLYGKNLKGADGKPMSRLQLIDRGILPQADVLGYMLLPRTFWQKLFNRPNTKGAKRDYKYLQLMSYNKPTVPTNYMQNTTAVG